MILRFKPILSLAIILSIVGCSREQNELGHHHDHDHGHHNHGHATEKHDAEDINEIILEPEEAERFGVETIVLSPSEFTTGIRASGRLSGSVSSSGFVSAPASGVLSLKKGIEIGSRVRKGESIGSVKATNISGGDVNAAALAVLNSAKAEMERLKPLYDKQLVTAEKYNAAVAAYEVAKASYSPAAASGIVIAPVSGVITNISAGQGSYVEAGETVAEIADTDMLTLTVDIPERYNGSVSSFDNADIIIGKNRIFNIKENGGRRIDGNYNLSAMPGYVTLRFSVPGAPGLISGSSVEVYLLGESQKNVLSLPLTALSEQQGQFFVYQQIDEEGYVKLPVETGARNGSEIEITHGLQPGMKIATKGVTALKLAETSGAVPEGHTHSH